jgi:predicted nucleic acid-binding protein
VPFILDASVALAWVLEEQQAANANSVLAKLRTDTAAAPSIWPVEVANALLAAQRRGRLPAARVSQAIAFVLALQIEVRHAALEATLIDTRELARRESLTVYDASYLDLAMREGVALATLDQALMAAANRVGVPLVE